MMNRRTTGTIGSALILLTLLACCAVRATAQESGGAPREKNTPLTIGLLGGVDLTGYAGSLDVSRDPRLGGGACAVLGEGRGSGLALGVIGIYRLSPTLSFGARLLREDRSGTLMSDPIVQQRRGAAGNIEELRSDYLFELDLPLSTIELFAQIKPFSIPLRVSAGPSIALADAPSYLFAEEIEGESEAAFANGTKRQEYAAGSFGRRLLFGLSVGADYPLAMGGGFSLVPGIDLTGYVNSPLEGTSGPLIAGIRPTIGVHYTFARPQPDPPLPPAMEPVEPPAPPPLPPVETPLVVDFTVGGLSAAGTTSDRLLVVVEEQRRIRRVPLLPAIFFDENGATIPDRYTRRGPSAATPTDYWGILDIIGARMLANPGARLTLTGTNADIDAEKGNTTLSRERAGSVRDYLTTTWGIASSRITIAARDLPADPSNPTIPAGAAENRRVEIGGDAALLAPIVIDESIRAASRPTLFIEPILTAGEPPIAWEIRVEMDGRLVRAVSGTGSTSRITETLSDAEVDSLVAGRRLTATMSARDADGRSVVVGPRPIATTLEQVVETDPMQGKDRIVLSTPILFPYNSAELTAENRATLEALRATLPAGATLTITGYADPIGETEYNVLLSRRRAQAVAEMFEGFAVTIEAGGEAGEGGALPEERFYARTISIEIEVN